MKIADWVFNMYLDFYRDQIVFSEPDLLEIFRTMGGAVGLQCLGHERDEKTSLLVLTFSLIPVAGRCNGDGTTQVHILLDAFI